jgi:hypothetical protein
VTALSQKIPSPFSQAMALWWLVLFGLLAMYVPTFYDLATTLWGSQK